MTTPLVQLGEVAEFVRGVTYKPEDLMANFSAGSVVCMRTANVQAQLDESDLRSIPAYIVKSPDKLLREGDILVSTANSWNLVGKCSWVPNLSYPAVPGGFIAALRADPVKIFPRYLYHWFNSPKNQADARNCGRQTTNISNMDLGRCLALQLPLPPLSEQRRISAILDKADALRAKRREAISKLDDLLHSFFLSLVADAEYWPKSALADLCADDAQITYGILQPGPDVETGVPYVRPTEIKNGEIQIGSLRRTTREIANKYLKSSLSTGDILITIVGTIGAIAVVPRELDGANITQSSARVRIDCQKADPKFVEIFLRSSLAKRQYDEARLGVAVERLNLHHVREIQVPIPPADVQRKIKDFSIIVEAIKSRHSISSENLKSFVNGLNQRAFAGGLL